MCVLMVRTGLAVGVIVAAAMAVRAQAPQPAPPVFRAGVDHVELDVVVTDKNDRPVKGLGKTDFEIVQNDKSQTITTFRAVSIPPVRRDIPDLRTTAPTIDVSSNQHPAAGRQWVIVIDDLHIIELHLRQTKDVVQTFLQSLPSEDQVAIVFVGRSDLSQDFTSDLGAQLRTVDRIKGSLGFAHDAANNSPIGEESGVAVEGRERHRHDISTIEVLKNICGVLIKSTYPRKALVYVSEGFTIGLDDIFSADYLDMSRDPIDARDTLEQLRVTFEDARHAGVPVYPIDPRGVPDCTAVRGDCTKLPWDKINNQFNNMRTLAENTGGRAFVGRPDNVAAVRELIDDNSSYYLLGYDPQPFERDGKFHDVDVRTTRPGLRVRARAGYTAPAAEAGAARSAARTLDDALGAGQPATGLTLRASAAPLAAAVHGMTTAVMVSVRMPVAPELTTLEDDIQFGIVAVDHDGKIKASTRKSFHFSGALRGSTDIAFQLDDTIDLPSQPLILRIAVVSQASGAAGSVHLPVEPINPSKDGLQVAALVVGLDGPQREQAMPPNALDALVPFRPTTRRTFAATDTLRLFGRTFWRSDSAGPAITFTIGGSSLPPHVVRLDATPGNGDRRQGTFEVRQPLAGLAPGSYTLKIELRLWEQAAVREVAFEVR